MVKKALSFTLILFSFLIYDSFLNAAEQDEHLLLQVNFSLDLLGRGYYDCRFKSIDPNVDLVLQINNQLKKIPNNDYEAVYEYDFQEAKSLFEETVPMLFFINDKWAKIEEINNKSIKYISDIYMNHDMTLRVMELKINKNDQYQFIVFKYRDISLLNGVGYSSCMIM